MTVTGTDFALVTMLLAYLSIFALFALIERRRYGIWLTPMTLLAGPLGAVMFVAVIFGPTLGYYQVSPYAVGLWNLALFVFGLVGFLIGIPVADRLSYRGLASSQRLSSSEHRVVRDAQFLGWVVLGVIVLSGARAILGLGVLNAFGESDALLDRMGKGIVGHLGLLRTCLIIILFGTAKRWFSVSILLGLALVATALLFSAKYHAIHPLIAAVFYRILTRRTRFNPRLVLGVTVLGVILFFSSYLIVFEIRNPGALARGETYSVLAQHYIAYAIGGVVALGTVIESNAVRPISEGLLITFMPFANLLNQMLGFSSGPLVVEGSRWIVVNWETGRSSNVTTLMGALWQNLGMIGACIYIAGFSLVQYGAFIFMLAVRHAWIVGMSTYFLTVLAFSWFAFYPQLLSFIEIPAMFLILFAVDMLRLSWASSVRRNLTPTLHTEV